MTVDATNLPSLPPPANASVSEAETPRWLSPALRLAIEAAVGPSTQLVSATDRSTARLAAAIVLGMLVTTAFSAINMGGTAPEAVAQIGRWILIACAVSHTLTYGLTRTRHATLGAQIFIATLLAVPVAFLFVGRAPDMAAAMTSGAWMAVSFTVAGALLPTRRLLPVAMVATAAFLGTLLHLATQAQIVIQATVLLGMSTTFVIVAAAHRDRLERLRGAELATRNYELSALRDSLESRVEERTAALAQANRDLAAHHARLLATERMAVLGRLSAGVAHEMSSPLGAAVCALGDLGDLVAEQERSLGDANVTDEDRREVVKEMQAAVDLGVLGTNRAVAFLRGMKAHTREQTTVAREPFDAKAAVRESLQLLEHMARSAHCPIAFEPEEDLPAMMGTPGYLTQVTTNLLSNAIDAGADRGGAPIVVRLTHEGTELLLEVSDAAGGIANDVLPHIFEPLFSTKPAGKGTGLGLSIVRNIVERDLGGRVEVAVRSGVGTSFLVHLPMGGD